MMNYLLEVCADSVQSAVEAEKGGAKRVELCKNLVIGGTSPGAALFKQVRKYTNLEIRVLLRPRFGDFCYDQYEFEEMKEDTAMYRELGADGIVTGILNPDGTLHMEQMKELVKEAGGMDVALHRAFDVSRNPLETLGQAIELGLKTILTSGQANSAWEGRMLLKQLVEKSDGRIEILAGAGINPEMIGRLAAGTGCSSFHMSGKKVKESSMKFRREGINMGLPGFSEWEIWQTESENIRLAVKALEECKKLM